MKHCLLGEVIIDGRKQPRPNFHGKEAVMASEAAATQARAEALYLLWYYDFPSPSTIELSQWSNVRE